MKLAGLTFWSCAAYAPRRHDRMIRCHIKKVLRPSINKMPSTSSSTECSMTGTFCRCLCQPVQEPIQCLHV